MKTHGDSLATYHLDPAAGVSFVPSSEPGIRKNATQRRYSTDIGRTRWRGRSGLESFGIDPTNRIRSLNGRRGRYPGPVVAVVDRGGGGCGPSRRVLGLGPGRLGRPGRPQRPSRDKVGQEDWYDPVPRPPLRLHQCIPS